MNESPYAVLGVKPDAAADEIRAAYRALARKLHPDAGSGSPDGFVKLQQAYEVLSDPERRRKYDAVRKLLETKPPEQNGNSLSWGAPVAGSATFGFYPMGWQGASGNVSFSPAPMSACAYVSTHVPLSSCQVFSGGQVYQRAYQNPPITKMRLMQIVTRAALSSYAGGNLLAQHKPGDRIAYNGTPYIVTDIHLNALPTGDIEVILDMEQI